MQKVSDNLPKESLRVIADVFRLNREDLEFVLRTESRTVDAWIKGKQYPGWQSRRLIWNLEYCAELVQERIDSDLIRSFLYSPNGVIASIKPITLLWGHEFDIFEKVLTYLDES